MNNITIMEFNNQRIMTTKVLAEGYNTKEDNINKNFQRNSSRFIEGKHYYQLTGESLKEFKNSLPTESLEPIKFAPVLYLWTEKGAARHAKILETDEAWEVYEQLEETYFRVRDNKVQTIDTRQLSPELQMFSKIFNTLASQELKQKEIENIVKATDEKVDSIKEIIEISPLKDWRKTTNEMITKICYKLNDYKLPKDEIYKALENRGACKLSVRLENLKGRLLKQGEKKSTINKLNNLDVIADDKKLIEIYVAIVKEMAIKYGLV